MLPKPEDFVLACSGTMLTLITQGMDTFQSSKNMTKHEAFGAVGTLTSALDMIKRAKDAGIIP
ncbi:hypothetical protein SAMN05444404_1752 [Ruegeria lacuscaerulensis ITI-1157]|nr:hypothetical protein SAMN05444404_1752 [Ruegeria lacuscaerulensis ITI-1157]